MTRVLLPVEVLTGETVSTGLMDLLGTVDVTVLGYHELPEQTPPDQARLQYEERATDALDDLAAEFREAGGAVDHRLVFTHDEEQTIDRIADEVDAAALAITGMTGEVDTLLVSLTGEVSDDRIVTFVADLVGNRDIAVTLFTAADTGDDVTERLDPAVDHLEAAGIRTTTMSSTSGSPFDALIDAVVGHDAIVMAERAPSLSSILFGDETERVASASVGPVLVVRPEDTSEE